MVKFDFAFKQIYARVFKCSLQPVGTTASGISQDSRSYDNNMSSNTTSSSFVSDDEVRYFKQTKVQCRFSNLPGK